MKIAIHHVPTGNKWTSDYISDMSEEEIQNLIEQTMQDKCSYLSFFLNKN